MQKFQYQIKPQIASVLSNKIRIPYFSFGEYLDEYSESSSPQITISFNVQDDIVPPDHLSQKFHFCYGADEGDEIYYERPLGLGVRAKLHYKNLFGIPEITVNKSYYRFIRSRIDNAYPPGVHAADTLSVKLLQNSYLPLHCAAISFGGEGMLLAAPPDTGKSITTLLVVKKGFGFLSEDIAIVDNQNVYANPTTATFYHTEDFNSSKSFRSKYFNFFYLKIPAISYFMDPPPARIYDIMKNIKIDEKVPIGTIFVLDKGRESIEEIRADEAFRRILIINRNEFSYHKNTLLFAYSYFNPKLNLSKLMEKEEEIIRTLTGKVKCFLIRTQDPRQYINLIAKATS